MISPSMKIEPLIPSTLCIGFNDCYFFSMDVKFSEITVIWIWFSRWCRNCCPVWAHIQMVRARVKAIDAYHVHNIWNTYVRVLCRIKSGSENVLFLHYEICIIIFSLSWWPPFYNFCFVTKNYNHNCFKLLSWF